MELKLEKKYLNFPVKNEAAQRRTRLIQEIFSISAQSSHLEVLMNSVLLSEVSR